MRQSLLVFSLLTAGMLGLSLLFMTLVDCIDDYQKGRFSSHFPGSGLKTAGLLVYSWLGLKFLKWRLVHQSSPTNKADGADM